MKRASLMIGVSMAALAFCAGGASVGRVYGLTNAEACRAAKLEAAGNYADCRMEEEARAARAANVPDYSRCDAVQASDWGRIEGRYGSACASIGDQSEVRDRVIGDTEALVAEMGGSMPTILRRFPASGQTTCVDGRGQFVDCAGTGQDGESLSGVALTEAYTDNLDGTITDWVTGLMWEKKVGYDFSVDGANPHDADNTYPWAGRCDVAPVVFCQTDAYCKTYEAGEDCVISDGQATGLTIFAWVAKLNEGAGFAGYTDWRIPNRKELTSIVDSGNMSPAAGPTFHASGCGGLCTDVTEPMCSCTACFGYWTSTMSHRYPPTPWFVEFMEGSVGHADPSGAGHVRAVRGGM